MSLALVGLATGLGARYPRFGADATQAAGSYGGVAFMVQAVLFILVTIALLGWPSSVYLLATARHLPLSVSQQFLIVLCFSGVVATSVTIWIASMRSGVRALEKMSE
jgi:Mn2+/Fe2+ NRAMP family transporter